MRVYSSALSAAAAQYVTDLGLRDTGGLPRQPGRTPAAWKILACRRRSSRRLNRPSKARSPCLARAARRLRHRAQCRRRHAGEDGRCPVPHRRSFRGLGAGRCGRARPRPDRAGPEGDGDAARLSRPHLHRQDQPHLSRAEQGDAHGARAHRTRQSRHDPEAEHVRRCRDRERQRSARDRGTGKRDHQQRNAQGRHRRQGRRPLRAARGQDRHARRRLRRDQGRHCRGRQGRRRRQLPDRRGKQPQGGAARPDRGGDAK